MEENDSVAAATVIPEAVEKNGEGPQGNLTLQ
jgi:hypothetical protein